MACKPNEIAILKATSVKLDADNTMLLALMYHTADKEAKAAGDKSFYRYEGRVIKNTDLDAEIKNMKLDENKLKMWTWPTKNAWWKPTYFLGYNLCNDNGAGAKWYGQRMKKALSWDAFIDLAKNGVKQTAKGPKTSDSAKYELTGYETEDGEKFDIDSAATMLKYVGKCFSHQIVMKRDLKA